MRQSAPEILGVGANGTLWVLQQPGHRLIFALCPGDALDELADLATMPQHQLDEHLERWDSPTLPWG